MGDIALDPRAITGQVSNVSEDFFFPLLIYPCKTNHFIIFSSSKTPMQSLSFALKKLPKMLKKPSSVMKKVPRRKYYYTALAKLKELKTF